MYLFKRKKRNILLQRIVSLIVLVSISVNVLPQSVHAISSPTFMVVNANIQTVVYNTKISAVIHKPEFPVSSDRVASHTMTVIATAYESKVNQTDDSPCIPAMSSFNLCTFYKKYGYGDTIAANFLPLGTRVRFPDLFGNKIFIVRDRMNARYGYGHVDIWMNGGAIKFGIKYTTMEIF